MMLKNMCFINFSKLLFDSCVVPFSAEDSFNILIELKAIVEEYENDISLRHIGFPEDWYEQLEK